MTQNTTRVDGIDVSHNQGTVDWPTVRAHIAGPGVAAWKVSQGVTTVDVTAATNRSGTKKAGFRWRLGYHWLSPNIDPIAQANWFLAHHANLEAGEGCILDAEEAGITEPEALAFCEHVENTSQRWTFVYSGMFVAGGSIWHSTRIFNGKRGRWLAAYEPEMKVRAAAQPYGFDCWQGDGGATGRFPGVGTGVDLNMVEHPIILDLACAIPATPTPSPTPTPSIDDGEDMDIVTNLEQLFDQTPNQWKAVVTSTGKLRQLSPVEWRARGSQPGVPLSNADISALGTA